MSGRPTSSSTCSAPTTVGWAAELLTVTAGGHVRARRVDAAAARRPRRRGTLGRRTRATARGTGDAPPAGSRRQGRGGLERARGRGARRDRRAAGPARPRRRGDRRGAGCSSGTPRRRSAAPGLARRRRRSARRRPRGLRRRRRRAADAVRRHRRRDLARPCRHACSTSCWRTSPTAHGGFFDTADDETDARLARRPQDPTDNATPSGWSAAAGALLSYAAYTGSTSTARPPSGRLGVYAPLAGAACAVRRLGAGRGRGAARRSARGGGGGRGRRPGDRGAASGGAARDGAGSSGRAGHVPGAASSYRCWSIGRSWAGWPTAYVCQHFTCDAPVTDPAALAASLGARL